MMSFRIKGAVLWGMLITAIIGIPMGVIKTDVLKEWQAIPSIAPTFLKLDFRGLFTIEMVTVIIVFFLTDMFDMIGTLIGVAKRAKLLDNQGRLVRAQKAFFADSIGSVFGSLLGTSTVTSYIESAAGVQAGGRTGMTGLIAGLLFILAIFVSPIAKMIGGGYMVMPEGAVSPIFLYPITGPVLIIVGILMVKAMIDVNWDDITDALPAFLIFIGIPLSFSISDGLALGLISYPIVKILAGRHKEVSWLIYILAALFIVRFFFVK
jgi:AGZA family xanthine/uracil permease-like MFS transporter